MRLECISNYPLGRLWRQQLNTTAKDYQFVRLFLDNTQTVGLHKVPPAFNFEFLSAAPHFPPLEEHLKFLEYPRLLSQINYTTLTQCGGQSLYPVGNYKFSPLRFYHPYLPMFFFPQHFYVCSMVFSVPSIQAKQKNIDCKTVGFKDRYGVTNTDNVQSIKEYLPAYPAVNLAEPVKSTKKLKK